MKTKILLLVWILFIIPSINFAQTNEYNLSNLISFDGEPSMAVNPVNPDNIISGWMRLRLDGRMWIATRASFDGGTSWSTYNFLPHIDTAYNSADVSIAFNNSGIAYLSYIDVDWSDTTATVFVTKSLDGGLTWESPVPVFLSSDTPDKPFDRPWIAVDNSGGSNDGTIYLTAMSLYYDMIYPHHIYLKSSTDGGNTWSNIKQVDDSLHSVGSLQISWGAVSVGGDGKIYIGYYSYDTSASPFVRAYVASTTDFGNSFQYNVVANIFVTATTDYTNGYSIAASPSDTGNVIMTWIDDRYGDADVVYSLSTNGGINWTYPARLNDDTAGNGVIQDRIWSYFSSDGKYSAAWRDRRLNGTGALVPSDIYLIYSTDGGNSFSQNYRMSDTSATHAPLPCCNSFLGVTINNDYAYAIWGEDRNTDWDIYVNKILVQTTNIQDIKNNNSDILIYPNPVTSKINIQFYLKEKQQIKIQLFDISGKQQTTIFNKMYTSGEHTINENLDYIPTGVYICRLTGKQFISQKLVIIKN